jgi:hypothetical protein
MTPSENKSNSYQVRFLLNIQPDLSRKAKDNLEKLEQRGIFSIQPIDSNSRVFNDDYEYMWFERRLSFIPPIGLEIGDAFKELDWHDCDITIVRSVRYYFEYDWFLVDLDHDFSNHLEVSREILAVAKKLK